MLNNENKIKQLVQRLSEKLILRQNKLVTAESCTGGGLAYALTELPGSSTWFERGFITYSNDAKMELLKVNPNILEQQGAVSEATACAMAIGALQHSHAEISLSITGIAGPDGGSPEKPVGTIWFGYANKIKKPHAWIEHFSGTRGEIRLQAILTALEKLCVFVEE